MKKPNIEKADLGPLPPLKEPDGAVIARDATTGAVTVTPEGLAHVEYLAAEFCTQGFIATKLGISLGTFEKLMGKTTDDPPTPIRAAWQAGREALRTETDRYSLFAMRKGNILMPMWIGKSEFMKRDSGQSIEIKNESRINFTLPGPAATLEEQLERFGQMKVIDTRGTALIRESMTAQKKTEAEIQEYLKSIGRSDDVGPSMKLLTTTEGNHQ